jgi:hypothetical protein
LLFLTLLLLASQLPIAILLLLLTLLLPTIFALT